MSWLSIKYCRNVTDYAYVKNAIKIYKKSSYLKRTVYIISDNSGIITLTGGEDL